MTLPDRMRQETTVEAKETDQKRYACRDCGIPFETEPDSCSNCRSSDITALTEEINPDFRD